MQAQLLSTAKWIHDLLRGVVRKIYQPIRQFSVGLGLSLLKTGSFIQDAVKDAFNALTLNLIRKLVTTESGSLWGKTVDNYDDNS